MALTLTGKYSTLGRSCILVLTASFLFADGAASSGTNPNWRDAREDCLGHYTLRLESDIEYAVQHRPFRKGWNPQFSSGLNVWGTAFSVDSGGAAARNARVEITSEAGKEDLDELVRGLNEAREKAKADLLRQAKLFETTSVIQHDLLRDAAAINLFKEHSETAYAHVDETGVGVRVLIGGRIVSASRKLVGSPQQTIDTFLKNYRPRGAFEVPAEPGVCLPYAFMTNEIKPADVAVSIRLKSQPDIVVFLHDQPVGATPGGAADAVSFLKEATRFAVYFYGSRQTEPLDGQVKPFHSVSIDGRKGAGVFVRVTRDSEDGPNAIHNEADKNRDWAYLAYVPGDLKAPEGTSSNLTFRVERFGRFAEKPMTEKEFRALAKSIEASIRRRPGAWRNR